MRHRVLRRVERAFDAYLARVARLVRLRRRRMKAVLVAVGFGSLALLLDAVLVMQAAQAQPALLLDWWAPVVAVATALIAFASLKTAFTAHRDYTDERMKEKASKEFVDGEVRSIRESMERIEGVVQRIEADVREIREAKRGRRT